MAMTEQQRAWLTAMLGAGPMGGPPQAPPAPASAGGGKAGASPGIQDATLDKAQKLWLGTRKRIDGDIAALEKRFASAFDDHASADHLKTAFRKRADTVLDSLGEVLAHALADVKQAASEAERAKLLAEAETMIHAYGQHAATCPTIAALDKNPFMPLAIGTTITTTLDAILRSVRR